MSQPLMGKRDDASALPFMIFGYDSFVVNETIMTFSRFFFFFLIVLKVSCYEKQLFSALCKDKGKQMSPASSLQPTLVN